MPEFEEIPEQISGLLALLGEDDGSDAGDIQPTEEWEELAVTYARLCRGANNRLRRCADYLRRGMRSEAMHLAECQPNLLHLVAALQIPEVLRWAKLCARLGLAVAPPLLNDLTAELQAAAARELELDPLLIRHRVLAVAKAPLRDRVAVLRALAEGDSDNPCWPADVRTLEAARLKEIRGEAKAAFRSKDVGALEGLWGELTSPNWRADVSDDLRLGLQRALDAVHAEQAVAELEPLLAELTAAWQNEDFEAGTEGMARWQALIESRQIILPREMRHQVRPIMSWLDGIERKQGVARKMRSIQPIIRADEQAARRRLLRKRLLIAAAVVVLLLGAGAVLLAVSSAGDKGGSPVQRLIHRLQP